MLTPIRKPTLTRGVSLILIVFSEISLRTVAVRCDGGRVMEMNNEADDKITVVKSCGLGPVEYLGGSFLLLFASFGTAQATDTKNHTVLTVANAELPHLTHRQ